MEKTLNPAGFSTPSFPRDPAPVGAASTGCCPHCEPERSEGAAGLCFTPALPTGHLVPASLVRWSPGLNRLPGGQCCPCQWHRSWAGPVSGVLGASPATKGAARGLLLFPACSGTRWGLHEGWQHPRGGGVPTLGWVSRWGSGTAWAQGFQHKRFWGSAIPSRQAL